MSSLRHRDRLHRPSESLLTKLTSSTIFDIYLYISNLIFTLVNLANQNLKENRIQLDDYCRVQYFSDLLDIDLTYLGFHIKSKPSHSEIGYTLGFYRAFPLNRMNIITDFLVLSFFSFTMVSRDKCCC